MNHIYIGLNQETKIVINVLVSSYNRYKCLILLKTSVYGRQILTSAVDHRVTGKEQ